MKQTNYTFYELINKYNIEYIDDDDDGDDGHKDCKNINKNKNKDLFVKIMNGHFNNNYDENYKNITDANILFNIGNYYNYIKKDYELMKKYYMIAIKKGNSNAMYKLGYYYYIETDYKLMEKYYMMAINKGNSTAMSNLSFYYFQVKKDYDLMEKYYLMSKLIKANIKTECFICYENKQMYYTKCNKHYICINCSIKINNNSCPICCIDNKN
jgi:hypothetical protein